MEQLLTLEMIRREAVCLLCAMHTDDGLAVVDKGLKAERGYDPMKDMDVFKLTYKGKAATFECYKFDLSLSLEKFSKDHIEPVLGRLLPRLPDL